MAGNDDPVSFSLPQAPLPAPARREAAIAEALRRFDGGEAVQVVASGRPAREPGGRPGLAGRPQLATLIAASVVAIIGLPTAWMIAREETRPPMEQAAQEQAEPAFDLAQDEKPIDRSITQPDTSPPPIPAEPAVENSEDRSGKMIAAPVVPGSVAHEGQEMKVEPGEGLAVEEARRADKQIEITARRRSPEVMAAPMAVTPVAPPPASVMQDAGSAKPNYGAETEEAVLTARKRLAKRAPDRGDWNACTVNDPRRSLSACRHLVYPGAKGLKGQAAAHLADGLSLAWQGQMDRAIAAFGRAIAVSPKSSLAYLNRGLAYQLQGDSGRALADLDRAVRLSPTAPRGYYNRSLLLRAKGDKRRAAHDEQRAVDLSADYEAVIPGARN